MYHHKSGAQKRKHRALRDRNIESSKRGQILLTNFVRREKHDTEQQENVPPELAPVIAPIEIFDPNPTTLSQRDEQSTIAETTETEECVSISKFLCDRFDIGCEETQFMLLQNIDKLIRQGRQEMPATFPRDIIGDPFPVSLLFKVMPNGEKVERDWLIWSPSKNALFCFPCRLFCGVNKSKSSFASVAGYSKSFKWKKLYDRIPAHENNEEHKFVCCNYVKWKHVLRLIRY